MPARVNYPERIDWGMQQDAELHRDYSLTMYVKVADPTTGPFGVLSSPGTPRIGSPWIWGGDNDPYARCHPEASCSPVVTNEPNTLWKAQFRFSTRPYKRCAISNVTSPLFEPQQISGSFLRYQREIQRDRFGYPITNSSYELLPPLPRDANRPTVSISQNVVLLELDLIANLVDKVNHAPMWGLPKRTIKMAPPRWTRKFVGTCSPYFERQLEFEIKYETWDYVDIVDKGTRVYRGGPGGRANPMNYVAATDQLGNRINPVLLDLAGNMLNNWNNVALLPPIQVYDEANFFVLNIPASLESYGSWTNIQAGPVLVQGLLPSVILPDLNQILNPF